MNSVNRRDLLKKAGLGALVLSVAPAFNHQLATPAAASGQTNFHFVALSFGPTIDDVVHVIALSGTGAVTPGQATGSGSFVHADFGTGFPAGVPEPADILATGTWKIRRLNSFETFGTWGVLSTGLMDADIDLIPENGSRVPAHLEVTCNLAPAGLFVPGKNEGYILTMPGDPDLVFEPAVPAVGLTVFTTENERRRGGG